MSRSDLERVARAICPDAWHETTRADGTKYFTLVCWDEEQARALREAKRAIEAIRVPSQAMQYAGRDANDKYAAEVAPCSAFRAHDSWTAMIDEILKEEG